MQLKASAAQKLAYYQASSAPGVLAPQGWHCIGIYGSSGADLLCYASALRRRSDMFAKMAGLPDQRYKSDDITGENGSGRFDVAQVLARVFPRTEGFCAKA